MAYVWVEAYLFALSCGSFGRCLVDHLAVDQASLFSLGRSAGVRGEGGGVCKGIVPTLDVLSVCAKGVQTGCAGFCYFSVCGPQRLLTFDAAVAQQSV